MTKSILVLHGPNLNRLGSRDPDIYGTTTLAELNASLDKLATQGGWALSSFQSNSESMLIDAIHGAADNDVNYMVINLAAFTHTSIAIREAIALTAIPFYEVHISNIFAREPFRHHSYLSDIAQGIICGFGVRGYALAVQAILEESNQESYQ